MKPTPAARAARIPSGAMFDSDSNHRTAEEKATRIAEALIKRRLRYTLPRRPARKANASAVMAQVMSNIFSAVMTPTRGSLGRSGVAPCTHVRMNAVPNTTGEIPATARRARTNEFFQTAVTQSPFLPFASPNIAPVIVRLSMKQDQALLSANSSVTHV